MIYLDSCIVIYIVERNPVFGELAKYALERSGEQAAVSPLVRMECLVKPLKIRNSDLECDFRAMFRKLQQLPVSEAAFEDAARIRAEHNLKTPDALHLAIAKRAGCTALWTNDDRFAKAAPGYAVDIRRL